VHCTLYTCELDAPRETEGENGDGGLGPTRSATLETKVSGFLSPAGMSLTKLSLAGRE
jgi:hypothetical protein